MHNISEQFSVSPEDPVERTSSVAVHPFAWDDPYISEDETFREVNDTVNELMEMGYYGDSRIDLERKRKSAIDRNNPATQELMKRLPSFGDWLDMVPTAGALDALYHPEKEVFANGRPVDNQLREWLCNIADGRGLRSRGAVVRRLMRNEALEVDGRSSWLSLASGAAQPVITAGVEVRDAGVAAPHMTLVDYDKRVFRLAKSYAEQAGLSDALTCRRMNILKPQGIDYAPSQDVVAQVALRSMGQMLGIGRLPRGAYDVVEAVGFTEYLQEENWGKHNRRKTRTYEYGQVIKEDVRDKPFAGARTFLENSYRLVKPGGVMVIGNMLDSHPQLGFTLNTIQWPHVQPRSIGEMTQLLRRAGIEENVDVYVPEDGVYAIYTVRKGV